MRNSQTLKGDVFCLFNSSLFLLLFCFFVSRVEGGQGGACVPRMPHGCGVTLTTFFPGVADCASAQC